MKPKGCAASSCPSQERWWRGWWLSFHRFISDGGNLRTLQIFHFHFLISQISNNAIVIIISFLGAEKNNSVGRRGFRWHSFSMLEESHHVVAERWKQTKPERSDEKNNIRLSYLTRVKNNIYFTQMGNCFFVAAEQCSWSHISIPFLFIKDR